MQGKFVRVSPIQLYIIYKISCNCSSVILYSSINKKRTYNVLLVHILLTFILSFFQFIDSYSNSFIWWFETTKKIPATPKGDRWS